MFFEVPQLIMNIVTNNSSKLLQKRHSLVHFLPPIALRNCFRFPHYFYTRKRPDYCYVIFCAHCLKIGPRKWKSRFMTRFEKWKHNTFWDSETKFFVQPSLDSKETSVLISSLEFWKDIDHKLRNWFSEFKFLNQTFYTEAQLRKLQNSFSINQKFSQPFGTSLTAWI